MHPMPRTTPTIAVGLLLTLSAPALAQTPATTPAQPAPAKPAESAKAEPKKDTAPAKAAYPEKVTKKLWASTDLRDKKAPELTVEAWRQEGKEIKAPDLKGKTILIDFWGISCPPCRTLIPELERWQEKFKSDLVVIGVGGDTPKALDNFEDLRGGKIKYALALDTKNTTYRAVGVEGIPHVLVISSDGIVRWQGFPLWQEEPLTEEKLKQIIDTDKAARAAAKPADTKADPAKPASASTGETKPEIKPPDKKG
jgi:thiol-disulfide isomerase/thioredoxin